jgi:membrane protease YdiL (CAAX protease family)
MDKERSSGRAVALAALTLPLVGLGWTAMLLVAGLSVPALGLKPGLILAELALAAPSVLAVVLLERAPAETLGLRPPPLPSLLLAALAGLTLWGASLGLMELQSSFWSPPPGYIEQFRRLHELLRPAGPADALLSVAAIALAPALCEELVFRGTVLPALQRLAGGAVALSCSAALFGAIHLDVVQASGTPTFYRVPFALCVGIGLGLLRLASGSLLAAMLAHALLNTVTLVLAPLVDDPLESARPGNPWLGLGLLLAGGLATAAVLRAIARRAARAARRPL